MSSIFSRIVAGEIPCYEIARDEYCFAFLDISPLSIGHTLVVPRVEVDYLFDLDPAVYMSLMLFSRRVALAIGAAVPCIRVGVAVIGLEVPHAHVHLIPLHQGTIDFTQPKLRLTAAQMTETASAIRQLL
jgi:histidine triad (HIT) family protein